MSGKLHSRHQKGHFEPTVMFFGLTNSPAIFQAMMNELLRDLINTVKVAAFIDNVIIETETGRGIMSWWRK